MRKLPFFPLLMLMIPLLAAAADTHHEMAGMNEENNSGTLCAASKAYLDSMKNIDELMDVGVRTDDPDVAFAQGMIPDHEGAIHMAEVELKYGKDPAMRKLAENIIIAQKAENCEHATVVSRARSEKIAPEGEQPVVTLARQSCFRTWRLNPACNPD